MSQSETQRIRELYEKEAPRYVPVIAIAAWIVIASVVLTLNRDNGIPNGAPDRAS